MEKLLVTGEPGVGKSTIIDKLHNEHPTKVVGIIAREIRDEKGQRLGFTSGTFENPNLFTIAHVDNLSEAKVGKYGVDTEALDKLADLLANQLQVAQNEKLVLIFDEIGWMQTFSEKLKRQIETVIHSNTPAVLTIKQDVSVSEWLRTVKEDPDVRVVTITSNDREAGFRELTEYVQNNS